MNEANELTQDGIFSRAVTLWQPARGYRFSVDAVLLGLFARPYAARAHVADLGAGVGVVGLALAFPDPAVEAPLSLTGIELQPRLAALARRNYAENRPTAPASLREADLRQLPREMRGAFGVVVSNPPYFEAHSGRPDPDLERAQARRELTASLDDVVRAARFLLAPGGTVALVYPAPGLPRLLRVAEQEKLSPLALRVVYARREHPGTLVLVSFRAKTGRNPPPLDVLPPCYLAESDGSPYPPTESLFRRGYTEKQ
jgi:tRNA1Val (adenine37-N6)-methyltransferase